MEGEREARKKYRFWPTKMRIPSARLKYDFVLNLKDEIVKFIGDFPLVPM